MGVSATQAHIQKKKCQPPPQALRFSHLRGRRETRVTDDEPRGTMGRVIERERETSGYEAEKMFSLHSTLTDFSNFLETSYEMIMYRFDGDVFQNIYIFVFR